MKISSKSLLSLFLGCLAAAALLTAAHAQDEDGKDHPLVGRYEGSTISANGYRQLKFDETKVLQAPFAGDEDHSGNEWLKLEGKITKIRYDVPADRSVLEVFRNYQSALQAKGFTKVFECDNDSCFATRPNDINRELNVESMGDQIDDLGTNPNGRLYSEGVRYALLKQDGNYVSLLVGIHGTGEAAVRAFVEVVETQAMETDKIKLPSADEMAAAIASTGKIDLYGIVFDFDKAVIKPSSKPQLDQIAALLKKDPSLKLTVTGHTDNQGSDAYNLDLSKRRADAVAASLTADYGITADRLKTQGKGASQPVADNATEAGRAKNRRVELAKS